MIFALRSNACIALRNTSYSEIERFINMLLLIFSDCLHFLITSGSLKAWEAVCLISPIPTPLSVDCVGYTDSVRQTFGSSDIVWGMVCSWTFRLMKILLQSNLESHALFKCYNAFRQPIHLSIDFMWWEKKKKTYNYVLVPSILL